MTADDGIFFENAFAAAPPARPPLPDIFPPSLLRSFLFDVLFPGFLPPSVLPTPRPVYPAFISMFPQEMKICLLPRGGTSTLQI